MTKAEQATRDNAQRVLDGKETPVDYPYSAMRQHAMEFAVWARKEGWVYDPFADRWEQADHSHANNTTWQYASQSELYDQFNKNMNNGSI